MNTFIFTFAFVSLGAAHHNLGRLRFQGGDFIQTLTSVLGGHLQKHIRAALEGRPIVLDSELQNLELDGPTLP